MRIALLRVTTRLMRVTLRAAIYFGDRRKGKGKLRTGETSRSIGLHFVVPTLLGYVEPLKKGYHLRTKGTSNFFLYARQTL